MARCPLCESDVPDGRPGCDACGQPFNRAMTARAAPDLVKRAIDAARKDLLASSRDPADSTFARSLVDRAEQTEAAGDFGRALDLARASRHALEIAKRKTRVAEALRHADAVLERAKKAGIETLAFGRNIEGARGLAARGHHVAAERLLRRGFLPGPAPRGGRGAPRKPPQKPLRCVGRVRRRGGPARGGRRLP